MSASQPPTPPTAPSASPTAVAGGGARQDSMRASRSRLAALLAVVAMLALGIVYSWVRLTTPFDGTLVAGPPPFGLDRGSIVLLPRVQGHPLTIPVRLLAVEGRDMGSWVRALFAINAAQPRWHVGQTLTYTILSHGQRIHVLVTLAPVPVGAFLRASWGTLLFAAAFLVVAVFVYARRPHDRITLPLLLCAAALFPATIGYLGIPATYLTLAPTFWLHMAAAVGAHFVFLAALLHAALLLPRPHPLTQRYPWIIPMVYIAPAVVFLVFLAVTWPSTDILSWVAGWSAIGLAVFVAYLVLVVATILSSYHLHRDTVTRQQVRWVIFGGVIAAGGTLVLNALSVLVGDQVFLSANSVGVLQTVFPITLAVAILRHRLFDIDVIINRTLVYSTLTGTLALVYFGCVASLQLGFRALTGQTQPLALVLSTLTIAALFQPLRGGIQHVIDRHFYRSKYDATRTIEAFGAQVRDELDLSQLGVRLIGVVEETIQPAHASLWLSNPKRHAQAPADERVAEE